MRRRDFLRFSGLGAASSALGQLQLRPGSAAALERLLEGSEAPDATATTTDEAFWRRIRAFYSPPADYIDLDHANTSPTSRPVFDAFVQRTRQLSHSPAETFNTMWDVMEKDVRPALANLLGTEPERFALMGNSTVGLNTVIHGFPLERGDEILVTDHEYPDMVESIVQRGRREGTVMRVVRVPTPTEDRLTLVARVAEAITPRTKLLLISHVSAWSGEILPVEEITAAARSRGVSVMVDAAQSVGMLDVSFDRIGCDFLVASLHKWFGAPLTSGVLVMRPEHAGKVWPLHPPSWDTKEHPMDIYEWSGTFNMAAAGSIADAIVFQRTLGAERKRSRMRYLGDYWQDRLRQEPRVRVLTPHDSARSFGVASVMVEGIPSAALQKQLRRRNNIRVQDKSGRYSPFANAVRVSPGPCATPRDLDRFVAAIRDAARNGIPVES